MKGEMFWIIHNDNIIHHEGFPRHDGYYFFPDMPDGLGGWSVHLKDLFPSYKMAALALRSRLYTKKKEIEEKIKKLEEEING